ncbi:MAG: adenosine kinase [Candidatus Pacebacteria bacterium]|nr:adenosine kinase [Candidatus Paceibacterota bacterium]
MSKIEVTAIGNAIVDVISTVPEQLVVELGLAKGGMTLIDTRAGEAIYQRMSNRSETSGGSAANTMVGFASLGGKPAYIGKVNNDGLGQVFERDLRSSGVQFAKPKSVLTAELMAEPTARCMILVTPDAQRTMATHLGISVHLNPADLDYELITAAEILYLEGYLFDRPQAKLAFLAAAKAAHQAGKKVALTLSDSFCVERHRSEFRELVSDHVDIVFANEAEAISLTEQPDYDLAVAELRTHCELVAVTRGAKGSVIISKQGHYVIDAIAPTQLVDTTGAGDLYAAGVLFGLVNGLEAVAMGRLGSLAASEVISHLGARPQVKLASLLS